MIYNVCAVWCGVAYQDANEAAWLVLWTGHKLKAALKMYSFMAVWVHRDTVMLSWRHNVGPFFWRHRLPLQQNNARPHVARNLCTIPGSWSSSTAYILTRHVTHWACLWCPGIGVYKSASCQCPGTLSVALLECIYCLHADDEDEIFLVNYHYRCRQCLY